MDTIKPEIRTFMLGAIGLSTAIWGIAFNLGAFKTIFYNEVFAAWVAVSAILLATIFIADKDAPIPWWGTVLMAIPTVAIMVRTANSTDKAESIPDPLVLLLSAFAFLVCLPYAIFVAVNIVNADLLQLPGLRLKIALVTIVLLVGVIGFLVGAQNYRLLTCGDFSISGNALPPNCRQGPPLQF